jgi:rhodanese-related sulfurtransferase
MKKHINLLALGGLVILLAVLFGFATLKITGKHKFKRESTDMLKIVTMRAHALSIDKVKSHSSDNEYTLIDIRTPKEYINYHISNSINIPFDRLLDDKNVDFFNSSKKKIIYGTSSVGANAAWMVLTQLGYDNLFILDSDLNDWKLYIDEKNIFSAPLKKDEDPKFDYEAIMKESEG